MRTASHRIASLSSLLLSLATAVGLLTACDRPATRPSADAGDTAIARAAPAQAPAAAELPPPASDSRGLPGDALDAAGNKVRDMAITTEINTLLGRDPALSALPIAVDTAGGRVVLRGAAPDTALRGRAAELARSVDGVRGVENELSVQPRP